MSAVAEEAKAEEEYEGVEFVVFDSTSFKNAAREPQHVLLLKGKVTKDSAMGYASTLWPEIPEELDKYMFTRCVVRSCAKHAKVEFFLTKSPSVGELALQFYIDWADSKPLPVERCYDSSRYFVMTFAPTKAHADSGHFATVGLCFPASGGSSDLARQCATDFFTTLDTIRKQLYNEEHAEEIITVDESFELAADEVLEIGGSSMKAKKKKKSAETSSSGGSLLLSGPPTDKKSKSKKKKKKKKKKAKKKKSEEGTADVTEADFGDFGFGEDADFDF